MTARRRWLPWLVLAGLLLAHSVANVVWVHQDRTLRSFDMGPHLEAQSYVLSTLRNEGLMRGAARVLERGASAIWPSTGYLPGALLASIFGHQLPTLRLFNLLFLTITVVCVFAIGARHSTRLGLLAAALVTLYPLVYGESRQFSADFWGLAVTSLGVLVLLRTGRFSRTGASLLAGVCMGLGLLLRPHSLLFWVGPLLVLGLGSLWRPVNSRRQVALNLTLAGGAAALASVSWWWGLLGRLLGEFRDHAGGLEDAFGHGPSALFYAKALPWCFSWWLLLLALVAAALMARAWRRDRRAAAESQPRDQRWLDWWVIAAWLLGGAVALCLIGVSHLRYLLPLCPALALLTARGLLHLGRRQLRRAAICGGLGLAAVAWLLDSFVPGAPGLSHLGLARESLGEVVIASGPPRVDPVFQVANSVSALLARRHKDGRGVFVRIFLGNLEGWEQRAVGAPLILAGLPSAVVSQDELGGFLERGRGHANVGAATVPLPCGPLVHRYVVTFENNRRLPPRPSVAAHKVFDGVLGSGGGDEMGTRSVIWYWKDPSPLDPCGKY